MIDRRASVFLDTGYLVALEDADDENHPTAREHLDGLGRMPTLTTTSYVLDEVVTFFNVRGQHAKAVELGEMLLGSSSVRMVHVGEDLLRRGFGLLREVLDYCRDANALVVWKFDRLGRSLRELIDLVNGLQDRGVEFVSLRESLDTTPGGKLVFVRISSGAGGSNLIYSTITSLDGCVADNDGNFEWAAPDEEVHTFVNDVERRVGAYLYGRRMYEVMRYWETAPAVTDLPPVERDYALIWQAADKVVYSRTLETVSSARTRIARDFVPEAIRQMKAQAERDIGVGGPDFAAHVFRAGLVDECHLFVTPIVVGGGKRSFPRNVRLELELLDERRFEGGVVHLHYSTRT